MAKLFDTFEYYIEILAYIIRDWLKILNITVNYTTIDDAFDSIDVCFRLIKMNIMDRTRQNGILKFTAATISLKQKLAYFGKLIILCAHKFTRGV